MLANPEKDRYEDFDNRLKTIAVSVVLALVILVLRLWYLQVMHGAEYAEQTERFRLHVTRLKAPRGVIYGPDESVILADNRPARDLVLVPYDAGDPEAVAYRLARLVELDLEGLLANIDSYRTQPFRQIVAKRDVSMGELTRVEEFCKHLPGVSVVVRPQRRYVQHRTAGQIVGYIREISADELEAQDADPRYHMGDLIGVVGLERMYEDALRGRDGQLCVNVYATDMHPELRLDERGIFDIDVDRYGHTLETEFRRDPTQGDPVFLTLDIPLQAYAEGLLAGLDEEAGALVVMRADTGAVLALASWPGYDPNVFVTRGKAMNEQREKIMRIGDYAGEKGPDPKIHRAYRAAYPPGSVFKILIALAALEEGVIDEHWTCNCDGYYRKFSQNNPKRCWRHRLGGHGVGVDVILALASSCDVFFYTVGVEKLGIDRISDWGKRFGFGERTGIDLPGEYAGLMPSRDTKEAWGKRNHPDDPSEWEWYEAETADVSIGQGQLLTTPLQNAVLIAAVTNGGRRVRPYLNSALGPKVSEPLVSEKTVDLVRKGLQLCVEKENVPSGTGKLARIPGMLVIGKTGTVQTVSRTLLEPYKDKDESEIPMRLRDHAAFVAGVPEGDPPIVVSVYIERGQHGGEVAPLAKKLIEFYYARQPKATQVAWAEGSP